MNDLIARLLPSRELVSANCGFFLSLSLPPVCGRTQSQVAFRAADRLYDHESLSLPMQTPFSELIC